MKTLAITFTGTHWRAKCHCGWAGEPFTVRADAEPGAAEHFEQCAARQRVAK